MRAESGDGLAGDGRIVWWPKSDVGPVDGAESGERLEGAGRHVRRIGRQVGEREPNRGMVRRAPTVAANGRIWGARDSH